MPHELTLAAPQEGFDVRTPEVLLRSINDTFLKLCSSAASLTGGSVGSDELSHECLQLLRRTFAIETLTNRYLVAVAGPQGTGKTSLVRTLYELDETWLPDNPGRGERAPVYVLEYAGLAQPEGWLVEVGQSGGVPAPVTRKIGPDEWGRNVLGDASSALRLELRVPARFFSGLPDGSAGMLVLPGYEIERPDNSSWQHLMRTAMAAAPALVIVMTESDLASINSNSVLSDLRKRFLTGSVPKVAITHSEPIADDPAAQQAIRERAADYFGLNDTSGVFCTWLGTGGADQRLVIPDEQDHGGVARSLQLRELGTINSRELRPLLGRIEKMLLGPNVGVEEASRRVHELLFEFEDAWARLRTEYERQIRLGISGIQGDAVRQATELGKARIEGARAWGERMVNFITLRPSENRTLLEQIVHDSWWRDGSRSPMDDAMPLILSQVIRREPALTSLSNVVQGAAGSVRDRVIALAKAGREELRLTPDLENDLKVLAARGDRSDQATPSKTFESSISMVPALCLTWAMIGSTVPELTDDDQQVRQQASSEAAAGLAEVFGNLDSQLRAGLQPTLDTATPVASILLIGPQHGSLLYGALHGSVLAGAAVGVAGVGAVVGAAGMTIKAINNNNESRMTAVIQAIRRLADLEYTERMAAADTLIETARRIVEVRLRELFGVDEAAATRDGVLRLLKRARYESDDLLAATSASHAARLG